jgi:hypothetical protein
MPQPSRRRLATLTPRRGPQCTRDLQQHYRGKFAPLVRTMAKPGFRILYVHRSVTRLRKCTSTRQKNSFPFDRTPEATALRKLHEGTCAFESVKIGCEGPFLPHPAGVASSRIQSNHDRLRRSIQCTCPCASTGDFRSNVGRRGKQAKNAQVNSLACCASQCNTKKDRDFSAEDSCAPSVLQIWQHRTVSLHEGACDVLYLQS